jgi:glycolate oxidase
MIPERGLRSLTEFLGAENILTRPEDSSLRFDATKLSYMPDAVAVPRSAEDVAWILSLANLEEFPVTPRGAGSGKSGGAIPVQGGLILSMDRFDRILRIDPNNLIAKAETGVITSRLQEEVEKLGLFYPPDPASIKISTIGGNVAENAGGLRAVKYGVTRDYVLGLTAVLPTGEIIQTGVETVKGVVGYDPHSPARGFRRDLGSDYGCHPSTHPKTRGYKDNDGPVSLGFGSC